MIIVVSYALEKYMHYSISQN